MHSTLVITIMSDDRPGIVNELSTVIAQQKGSWLQSHFADLAGKFTGIMTVSIPDDNRKSFVSALALLKHDGIDIRVEETVNTAKKESIIRFTVIANDRVGIVSEISSRLRAHNFSIHSLTTETQSGSMSGIPMFSAKLSVILTDDKSEEEAQTELAEALEALSDDLMIEFK